MPSEEMRAAYLDLARIWRKLADDAEAQNRPAEPRSFAPPAEDPKA